MIDNQDDMVTISSEVYRLLIDELFKMKVASRFICIEDDNDYWDAIEEFYDENKNLIEVILDTGRWCAKSGDFLENNQGVPSNLDNCFDAEMLKCTLEL